MLPLFFYFRLPGVPRDYFGLRRRHKESLMSIFKILRRFLPNWECIQGNDFQVILLNNQVHYFIETVFIICEKQLYRLIAVHHDRLLFDRTYPSLRGAKIAFHKFFKVRAYREKVKAYWSPAYKPDLQWWAQKTQNLGNKQHENANRIPLR